jgi:hypothetical protein
MTIRHFSIFTFIVCGLIFGCGQNNMESNQSEKQAKNSHMNEYQGTVEKLVNDISYKNSSQKAEMKRLLHRISKVGIAKFHIKSLESGTMGNIAGGRLTAKKILVWNNAGRRLYSTVSAAQDDGFMVWKFYPDSKAANLLKETMKNEGGYNDDLLLIFWDGIF